MKIKKIHVFTLCLVLASSFLFTGCLTALLINHLSSRSMTTEFNKSFKDNLKASPSDSVLVYGNFNNTAVSGYFVQADTTKKPGPLPAFFSSGILISRPVEPGSRYKLISGHESGGRVSQTVFFGLNGPSILDFSVPNKPGLFYYGDYKVSFLYGNVSKKTFAGKKEEAAAELKILQKVKELCASTEWEPIVKARIEELQNAK